MGAQNIMMDFKSKSFSNRQTQRQANHNEYLAMVNFMTCEKKKFKLK